MSFRQLIRRMQDYSSFSASESREALIMIVESIASRLEDGERRIFAAQLPEPLQDIALSVYPALGHNRYDILSQFMYYQNVGKSQAMNQINAAWQTISELLSDDEIIKIKFYLPGNNAALLS